MSKKHNIKNHLTTNEVNDLLKYLNLSTKHEEINELEALFEQGYIGKNALITHRAKRTGIIPFKITNKDIKKTLKQITVIDYL